MRLFRTGAPKPPLPSHSANRRTKRDRLAGLALALGLIVFALAGLWRPQRASLEPRPLAAQKTVTVSMATPDEAPIEPNVYYEVPADQPRRIMLPTLNTEGFMQRVGLDQKGAMAVPENIGMAGWFVGGGVPGADGLSIIDGHVQGRYAQGIFKNLARIAPGDVFRIEYGDRSTKTFQVVSIQNYPTAAVNEPLFKHVSGIKAQLNLITCGGKYNAQTRQYDQRTLVVSTLVN